MPSYVKIGKKRVSIVPAESIPPISHPIQYISEAPCEEHLPEELQGCELKSHVLQHRVAHWKKNKIIPIAVIFSGKLSVRRTEILTRCREAAGPVILFHIGTYDPDDRGIALDWMKVSYNLPNNVILFCWKEKMSARQAIVFQYLLRHWNSLPKSASAYLEAFECIPNYNL